jgi:hypothetical protein
MQYDSNHALMKTEIAGLPAPQRGKVRDVYDLGDSLLFVASRSPRVSVAEGSIWYSAVIQPPSTPCAFIQPGTLLSRETAQTTRVFPDTASTDASG